jgi:hypothetical protein
VFVHKAFMRTRNAAVAEAALHTRDAHAVHQVLRQSEGHDLAHGQVEALVKEAAKVDVHDGPRRDVDQQVLAVPVSEAHDVAGDGPRRRAAREVQARL